MMTVILENLNLHNIYKINIYKINKAIPNQTPDEPSGQVFDGCAMVYRITWPTAGTMADVCNSFVSTIMHYVTPAMPLWVMFDSMM